MTPLYVFLHIPKTGGTTMRWHILNNYTPEEVIDASGTPLHVVAKKIKHDTKFIIGHQRYGLHWFYKERPIKYITILRDPLERYISNYYFLKRQKDHPAHSKVKDKNMSEYLAMRETQSFTRGNLQAYYLGIDHGIPSEKHDAMLDVVVDNIKEMFEVVGLTENYKEMLWTLQAKDILPNIIKVDAKAAVQLDKNEKFTEEELSEIKKINSFDQSIYKYVAYSIWSISNVGD